MIAAVTTEVAAIVAATVVAPRPPIAAIGPAIASLGTRAAIVRARRPGLAGSLRRAFARRTAVSRSPAPVPALPVVAAGRGALGPGTGGLRPRLAGAIALGVV